MHAMVERAVSARFFIIIFIKESGLHNPGLYSIMKIIDFSSRRTPIKLLLMAIIIAASGCSGNNKSPSTDNSETPERKAVNTEGFSFIYQGPPPTSFSEAPELAKRVAARELPPVEDRLPDEPLIIPPIERIGQYGGTWRRGFTGVDTNNVDRLMHDHIIYFDLDGYKLVPHIAKGWEISEDGTSFTFYLREGMKWSDGAPFTADDFVFAYEEIILNDQINPTKPSYAKVDGKMCKVEKIDETTVRYTFHKPNFVFIENAGGLIVAGQYATGGGYPPYAPRHYLRQFLPKYTPLSDLKSKMKEIGLRSWVELFKHVASPHRNRDLPVVGPWKLVTPITDEIYSLERNPYYFAVDPEGNQLPYIDKIVLRRFEDLEVFNARVMTGEVDMQHRHVLLDKVPLLKREGDKGNFRLFLWPNLGGSDGFIYVNQTWHGDPEIEKWLRSRDFRIALSLAIDREEINELIFLGLGVPRAFLPFPDNPYYPGSEYENRYAIRNLEESNANLDALGLDKKDREGYRLRTDNQKRLVINLTVPSQSYVDFAGISELLVNQWKDVGIAIHLSVLGETFVGRLHANNELHLTLGISGGSENPWTYPNMTIPVLGGGFAPLVGDWYLYNGQKGVAPTGALKRLLEIYEEGNSLPKAKRIELGKELWRIHSDNLYNIGIVGQSPAMNGVVVVKNNFRNVPAFAPNSATLQTPGIARPEQFFFEQE